MLTNHGLRAKKLWLTRMIFIHVSKSFSPGSGAVSRVRPLNLLLAEHLSNQFQLNSTLSNESVQATHKPNKKSFTQVYISLACALFETKAGLEPCPITFIKSLALFLSATVLFLPWEYLYFFCSIVSDIKADGIIYEERYFKAISRASNSLTVLAPLPRSFIK